MTEGDEDIAAESVEAEVDEPRCGERLAAARREQQISVVEVAKELHLDEPKVRALERNEFEVLGAPVFAKGHLRKYAQLVGVDEDDVFADYYTMTRADGMPPIVSRRKKIREEMSPGPWIAAIVVLLVAAAAYWWFVERPADVTVVPQETPAVADELPAEAEITQAEPAQPEESTNEPDAEAVQEQELPAAVPEASPAPVVEELPQIATDQIRLTLNFSGECWTEINAADGEQMFFRMGRAGESVELTGKAPVTALFGNADNVEVLVNDNAYSLPAPNSANRTVRVAILNQ